ncbi:MAG: apolipoprotein N-acyltransferase [Lentisphaerae bacterium]|nr:apolipoprotein N-acyltransferase [Lentisphaerota bacterium]
MLKSLGCLAAGASLAVAFPENAEPHVAWFAFVPLLIILRFSTPGQGFLYGFLHGIGFWLLSISWLMELRNNGGPVMLVLIGLTGLSIWCSLFSAVFGYSVSLLWQGGDSATAGWKRYFFETWRPPVIALIWCGGEYLRSTLFTGFAWNAVGVSQVSYLPIVQLASLGGVYAVSFLVLLVNGALAGVCVRLWRNTMLREPNSTRRHFDLMTALLVLFVAIYWGRKRISELQASGQSSERLSVVAIDPDLPCIFSINESENIKIAYSNLYEKTDALSLNADLVVWPETSLPSCMPDKVLEKNMLRFASQIGAPILAGTTEFSLNNKNEEECRNSTFLFGTNGVIESVYSKQHLVPFGEFLPFDKKMKFLQKLAPTGVSCTPGEGAVVMEVNGIKVSPLICFEDTVASLSRAAVKAGAQILIAQSNDSWFYGSSEAVQHHAQAIFRAVENAVPLVRCSNRGITAFVSPYGGSQEFLLHTIPVYSGAGSTLYSRFGDWIFGIPCAVIFIGVCIFRFWNKIFCKSDSKSYSKKEGDTSSVPS